MNKIKVTVEVPVDDIIDILIGALEGGSNYWYFLPDISMARKHFPKPGYPISEALLRSVIEHNEIVPVHDNEDRETQLGEISLKNIERGLQLYIDRGHPLKADLTDAEDSDVLFQFIVMGEIVFG